MDHSTARQLMAVYERMGKVINDADEIMRTLPETERSEHLRALCVVIEHLWSKLQWPVVREHPDLDPDGDRFQQKKPGQ